MTRIDTPGKFGDKGKGYETGKAYQAKSFTENKNPYMRSFARDKRKTRMTSYDSAYAVIRHTTRLSTCSVAGVIVTQFSNAIDKIWEYGHVHGNMKDLDATQETAFKLITAIALQVSFELNCQQKQRNLLKVFTESDAGSFWTQNSYDTFISGLEGLPLPKFVVNFIKLFNFIIKLSDEYTLHTVTVPACYVIPFSNSFTLAEMQACKIVWQQNLANAIAHAEKFGIPMTTFSASMIQDIRTIAEDAPDARAYYNHIFFKWYDDGTNGVTSIGPAGPMQGTNMTTDYTERKFFFPGNGPDSRIDGLAPLFGLYHAVNNINGGWFLVPDVGATEGYVSIYHMAQYATALTQGTTTTLAWYLPLILAFWDGKTASTTFKIGVTSDHATTVDYNSELSWPLATYKDLWYGTGVSYNISLDFLLSNLSEMMYK